MQQVLERDLTKTWTGLPAPDDWHVTGAIWNYDKPTEQCGLSWERLFGGKLAVWEDVSVKSDGLKWLHVSISKAPSRKMPTYDDIQLARALFIGEDRECYMVFPPKDRYVNINPVLHLWCCLDVPGGILPRFEGFIEGVRTI